MEKQTVTSIVIIIITILVILFVFTKGQGNKEGYALFDHKDIQDVSPKIGMYLDNTNTIISNGVGKKHEKYKGMFHYEFYYNLPNLDPPFQTVFSGESFIKKLPKSQYKVFSGQSKEDMTFLGFLARRGDGIYHLEVDSEKDDKVFCLVIGSSLIHCSEFI